MTQDEIGWKLLNGTHCVIDSPDVVNYRLVPPTDPWWAGHRFDLRLGSWVGPSPRGRPHSLFSGSRQATWPAASPTGATTRWPERGEGGPPSRQASVWAEDLDLHLLRVQEAGLDKVLLLLL